MLWLWATVAGVILIAALVFAFQQPIALIALLFIIGQILVSAIMAMVLVGIASSSGRTGRSNLWIANGVGAILFILLIFAYSAGYDIKLPYNHTIVEPIAGGIIAACTIGALVFAEKKKINVDSKLWSVPIFALILLALPLAQMITWRTPTAVAGQGFPVTVMTYNLNNGFNPRGQLDIDEIAEVIETNRPDIVAVQEVSRGWLVNGRLDMLAWLSYRLQMPYVFEPTTDPFSGNAILSRYPITAYSIENLPPSDSLIQNGFIVALVDLGEDEPIKVITTQLDTVKGATDVRQAQVQKIIDFWGALNYTVLLGDFSASPQNQELVKLSQTRLADAALMWKFKNTFPSNNPQERRDYIWTSPDLRVSEGGVTQSTASNHLPVVAVINR